MTAEGPGGIVRIAPAGDSAVLVEWPQRIDRQINGRAIALAERLQRRCGAAVRDAVVGYATLTVYFDPLVVDSAWLEAEIRDAATNADASLDSEAAGGAIEVPVCYEAAFGPDLDDVAAFGGCTRDEVIALHSEATYRVYMVGFVPGFAYMASVDPRIAAPRRGSPRPAVPAGSVAIAGGQTGVYPSVTPGGWNIIGRTPVMLYDPARESPFLFKAGATVRFRPISKNAFEGTH